MRSLLPSPAGHGTHRDPRTAPQRRGGRSVRDRLRQRGFLDLLRARPGRGLRAGAHAGRVHARRRAVRAHRQDLCRGSRDVSRGRRLLELRPPRVQRARLVHRRLGAEPRLHPHDRDLGVLRASLPGRVLAGADAPARGRDRWDHCDRASRLAEHPRDRRVGEPEPDPRGARPRHPGADHLHRRGARAEPVAARPPGRSRHDADVLALDLRAVARDARLHGDRDRLEHGRGGGRPGPGRAASGQLHPRSPCSACTRG